jgi:ribosomal-protein-alanine N-acetyltransferase
LTSLSHLTLWIYEMESKKVVIKKMEAEHLADVLSIENSSSQSPWSEKMFIEELKNPFAHCFTIRTEETPQHQVTGFICFRNIRDESELFNIAVHPHFRQLGIGKTLMEFYFDFCEKRQIKSFFLEVNSSNASAIHLYQLFYYQPIGIRKKFYQEKFDALLMIRKI